MNTDYKIKDMSLAKWGRKEIELAEKRQREYRNRQKSVRTYLLTPDVYTRGYGIPQGIQGNNDRNDGNGKGPHEGCDRQIRKLTHQRQRRNHN